jgi:hypothetical protein
MPEQEKVAAELCDTFSPEDLRSALRATGSADRDRVIEWILAWSEVEWIIANGPDDRMPIGIEPIVRPRVARPAPAPEDAERKAAAIDRRKEWAEIQCRREHQGGSHRR